jgi:hypothetical protein
VYCLALSVYCLALSVYCLALSVYSIKASQRLPSPQRDFKQPQACTLTSPTLPPRPQVWMRALQLLLLLLQLLGILATMLSKWARADAILWAWCKPCCCLPTRYLFDACMPGRRRRRQRMQALLVAQQEELRQLKQQAEWQVQHNRCVTHDLEQQLRARQQALANGQRVASGNGAWQQRQTGEIVPMGPDAMARDAGQWPHELPLWRRLQMQQELEDEAAACSAAAAAGAAAGAGAGAAAALAAAARAGADAEAHVAVHSGMFSAAQLHDRAGWDQEPGGKPMSPHAGQQQQQGPIMPATTPEPSFSSGPIPAPAPAPVSPHSLRDLQHVDELIFRQVEREEAQQRRWQQHFEQQHAAQQQQPAGTHSPHASYFTQHPQRDASQRQHSDQQQQQHQLAPLPHQPRIGLQHNPLLSSCAPSSGRPATRSSSYRAAVAAVASSMGSLLQRQQEHQSSSLHRLGAQEVLSTRTQAWLAFQEQRQEQRRSRRVLEQERLTQQGLPETC